jgi:hypothetical protein
VPEAYVDAGQNNTEAEKTPSPLEEELDLAVESLNVISNQLTWQSTAILVFTLLDVIFLFLAVYTSSRVNAEIQWLILSLELVIALLAIVSCFRFDMLRRQGNGYFEEISDALHNMIATTEDREGSQGKLHLHVRIIMRKFSSASDLPLIPGKYGPAAVSALNLALASISLMRSTVL